MKSAIALLLLTAACGEPSSSVTTSMKATAEQNEAACFDSYCPRQALAVIPATPASQRGSAMFLGGFKQQLTGAGGLLTNMHDFYDAEMRAHDSSWPYHPMNLIVNSKTWDGSRIMRRVGLDCRRAFLDFKASELAAGRASPDASTLDWTRLPACKAAGSWLATAYDAWFKYQVMNHDTQPAQGGQVPKPWDPFGIWKVSDTFSPASQWWTGGATFYPMNRYSQLLPSDFLARARPRIMAALCGLEVGVSNVGTWDFRSMDAARDGGSSAQWLLRINSWAQMTTALIQTEKRLGLQPAAQNCAAGTYSSTAALATAETLASNMGQAVTSGGLQHEYHSSYGNYFFEQLAELMSAPSSQKVYDAAASVYRAGLWDTAANYQPSSGSVTGPASRNYDLLLGTQNSWEGYIIPLYVQPYVHPYCDKLATCVAATPAKAALPVSAEKADRYVDTFFAMWQLGGYGALAHPESRALVDHQYRTVIQRAGFAFGRDRQHFIAPSYSLGNSGDDPWMVDNNYQLTARLGGDPNPAYPKTPDRSNRTDRTFTVGEIRSMLTHQDNPFVNNGVPLAGAQLTPRQVVAQYQSFMLVTQMAVPSDVGQSLSSNLLFPLAVDGIYADGLPLTRTNNSAMAVPPGALLTLRLGNASIVIRTLVIERSAGTPLADATSLSSTSVVAPGSGAHRNSVHWQVDDASYKLGYGKVVFNHKASSDRTNRPYHVAWLWAGGLTRNATELAALQKLVREAPVTVNTQAIGGKWNYTSNMFTNDYQGMDPVGFDTWTIGVNLAGQTLQVKRKDSYFPWNNSQAYRLYNSQFPFTTTEVQRTVNGKTTMPDNNWAPADLATFVSQNTTVQHSPSSLAIPYTAAQYFQPHLTGALE